MKSNEKTVKERMSKYVETVQRLQRKALGIIDMEVRVSTISSGDVSIDVHIFPRNEKGELIMKENPANGCEMYSYEIDEWYIEKADETMKELNRKLRELKVL